MNVLKCTSIASTFNDLCDNEMKASYIKDSSEGSSAVMANKTILNLSLRKKEAVSSHLKSKVRSSSLSLEFSSPSRDSGVGSCSSLVPTPFKTKEIDKYNIKSKAASSTWLKVRIADRKNFSIEEKL